jgi:DNA-binding HxlR family transcriptional regulator
MASQAEPAGCEALRAVFAVLGRRWSGLIVATLLEGPARFNQLLRRVAGISERMLSVRLGELIGADLMSAGCRLGHPSA